jgi:hypothetical protein
MCQSRPALFRGRHLRDEIIILCVRRYLRYPLSYRDPEEMMAERGLGGSLNHCPLGSALRAHSEYAHQAGNAAAQSVVAGR